MTSFPYLDITAEHDGSRHVLRLQGELDICNKDCLRRAISSALEHHPPTLVLDLSALGFMDCSGLSVLVWAHKLLAGQQRQLLITGSQPIVQRLICLMGLDTYLHLSAQETEQDTPDQSRMPTLGNRWRQRTRPPLGRNGE
jgi:anti-sigma B factor antagonist